MRATPVTPASFALDRLPRLRVPAYRWAAGGVLSALVVLFLVQAAPWDAIRDAARLAIDAPAGVIAVFIVYTAAFWLRAVAWRLLMTTPIAVGSLFGNLQASLVLNHVFPLKAGEISRPVLAVRRGASTSEAVTTTMVARLLDLACLAVIAVVALPLSREWGTFGFAAQAGMLALGAAIVALLVLRQVAPSMLPIPFRRGVEVARAGLRAIPMSRLALALPIVGASWVLEASVLVGAADLLGIDLSWRLAVGVTAFTILFQVVHVTPGGLGIYEAAMTSALVSQGIEPQAALGLAVVTHAMKFAYAFTVGALFASGEAVSLLRGHRAAPRRASRFEVVMARLWNVVNEGKPFTPLFSLTVVVLLILPAAMSPATWANASVALVAVAPLVWVFWRFDFPMRLRIALWVYLVAYIALTRAFPLGPVALVVGLYLGFTVVLWGTVYYHLRIGTKWTNGFRFIRLVAENQDPTSGNLLEQLPKVLLLVLMFEAVAAEPGPTSVGLVLSLTAGIAVSALLLHQWFFTWVPALPRPRITTGGALDAEVAAPPASVTRGPRRTRRVIAIVVDGCRADRLVEARTPFLDQLRAEGTEYRAMSTVYPARTVTCFSSMLTGAAAETHGMHSNFVPSLGVKCESLFDVLRADGMTGRLVGIAHLIDAFGDDDVRTVTAVMHNDEIDDALIMEAQRTLLEDDPELLVLQLLSVDQTGHSRGSYNDEYLRKIEETDTKIEAFLAWCRSRGYLDGASVIVTADHGQGIGIGGHGHMAPTEARIPCILWGEGIEAGRVSDEPVFITDFAPTISHLLGIPAPRESIGRSLIARGPDVSRPVVFVIPAYNEAENLPRVLAAIAASGVPSSTVLVVDDGSTDRTAEVAKAAGAVVVSHDRNRGLGAAVRTGLAAAREFDPRAVVYLDADAEYDGREASRLLVPIEAGEADYVLGWRSSPRPGGMTFSRRLANRAFSLLLSVCCGRWIRDGQTGYRAFSPRALEVAEVIHDYNYAQVLTLDLLRKGMRLCQVPITYRRRDNGRSFVSKTYLWRVPLGMMREMLRG